VPIPLPTPKRKAVPSGLAHPLIFCRAPRGSHGETPSSRDFERACGAPKGGARGCSLRGVCGPSAQGGFSPAWANLPRGSDGGPRDAHDGRHLWTPVGTTPYSIHAKPPLGAGSTRGMPALCACASDPATPADLHRSDVVDTDGAICHPSSEHSRLGPCRGPHSEANMCPICILSVNSTKNRMSDGSGIRE
jgi:hypothetical protein